MSHTCVGLPAGHRSRRQRRRGPARAELNSVRRLDELAQNGYCRLPTFLSPAEAAGWLQRLDECRGSFRAVGGKGGLGLPFHMMDGEQAMARLGDICAQLQPRLQEVAERVTGKRPEPIPDERSERETRLRVLPELPLRCRDRALATAGRVATHTLPPGRGEGRDEPELQCHERLPDPG